MVWAGPRLLGQERVDRCWQCVRGKKPSLKVTQTYGVETQAGSLLFPVLTEVLMSSTHVTGHN